MWRAMVFAPQGKQSPPLDFLPEFRRLVEEALAPMGINIIIFDMHWCNFRFTCLPEFDQVALPEGRSFTKNEARKMSGVCRTNGIRVMVGMNFLTHQNHGQLLKAFPTYNWPGTNRLWDPLNPAVNRVAFAMADELIEAFQADGFHVGMDEGWDFDVSTHPRAARYTPATLLAKCIIEYHEHLVKKRGVEMLIWSDMLEDRHGKGTGEALALIPKDVIICYWDYGLQKDYPWLKGFTEKGFRVLGCPWKEPLATQAIVECVLKIDDPKMLGVLYTTWCGKIASDLRPALLQEGDLSKLDGTAKGVAESMRTTLPLLQSIR
jgi:hypothetical protein